MTINVNQHEYIEQAGDTAGVVAVIRPQNQMPFPEDDGIIVSPGHATSIAITQVKRTLSCSRELYTYIKNFILNISIFISFGF